METTISDSEQETEQETKLKYEKIVKVRKEYEKKYNGSRFSDDERVRLLHEIFCIIDDTCYHGKKLDVECKSCKKSKFLAENTEKIENMIERSRNHYFGKYPSNNIDKAAIHYRMECKYKVEVLDHSVFFEELKKD